MTDSGDAQATGDDGLSESQAADRIASLLAPKGDSDGSETQGDDTPEEADEEEETSDDAEQSEDEDTPEEQPEQPQSFTVKVDGEEVAVTLDELRNGYSRTQDYTRKTMEVAEQRKAAEAELQAVRQEREQYEQLLPQLRAYLEEQLAPSEDLQALRYSDPGEYAARMEENRQIRERIQAVTAEQTRLAETTSRESQQARQQTVQTELAKLVKALPEWNDPKVRDETMQAAISYGFTPEEINDTIDHRAFVILRKAALYDRLKAKAPETAKKVEAVKTARPGGASQPSKVTDLTRSKQRLAKTGNVNDAAAVLLKMLG